MPKRAAKRLASLKKKAGVIPLAGIVFLALSAKRNLGLQVSKQQTKENYGRKKNHDFRRDAAFSGGCYTS